MQNLSLIYGVLLKCSIEKTTVFCFGCAQYLSIIVNSRASVYHERTEHPLVVPPFPSFLQSSYLKACSKLKGMFVISTALKKLL